MLRRIALLGTLLLAACDGPELYIESDTSWTGKVTGEGQNQSATVEGTGDKTFDLRRGTTCWDIEKTTAEGTLTVYAKKVGDRRTGEDRTTGAFGSVNGCV